MLSVVLPTRAVSAYRIVSHTHTHSKGDDDNKRWADEEEEED